MVITNTAPPYTPAAIETISPEDFETASVRSAAPSYTSDAPSYHSTVPLNSDPVPPYSPPARLATPAASSSLLNLGDSGSNLSRPQSSSATTGRQEGQQRIGLPPVPTGPRRSVEPSLGQFRIPSWSTIHSNPTARHYHSVALRRVAAASNEATTQRLGRIVLDRIEEEERNRSRPLEDPHLVGEEAAARARRERLARENGDEILIREDRRWDWFLSELSARKQPRSRFTMGCR